MPIEKGTTISRVLVLYVGGTIGMKKNGDSVYVPAQNLFLDKLKFHSQMHDTDLAKTYFDKLKPNQLVLPLRKGSIVLYQLEEYQPLLDSSNMSTKEWTRIAQDIESNYNNFDGFVILHGTDTMPYTSSALSFMLDGLKKPVIITGAQIPIFETRSDAKDNILASVILAGCCKIPEVCIFFATKLYRGNRTSKTSSDQLDAFASPNYHHLADVGINITLHHKFIADPPQDDFKIYTDLNPNVGLLCFFPTITPAMLRAFLQPPVAGIVLQSYGSGNISMSNQELLQVLSEAIQKEVIIVNVSQCAQGAVMPAYEGAKALEKIGVVFGFDMTVEAALTKLCYVLGHRNWSYHKKIDIIKTNIRGELSDELD